MPCIYPHARDRAIRRHSPSYVGRQSNRRIGLDWRTIVNNSSSSLFFAKKGRSRPVRTGLRALVTGRAVGYT